MIAAIIMAGRLLLEVIGSCHCRSWLTTPHGARCVAPLDHARCEFVDGWHDAAYGVSVCSHQCGD